MSAILKLALIAAHFSVYVVTALNIWIFHQRSEFYQTEVKLRSLPAIYWGFACYAIGSSYEIAEDITDNWFYVSRLSALNLLFYTFISGGVCLIAWGLRRSRLTDILLLASLVLVPLTYGVNDSKSLMQLLQLVPAVIFVLHWYWVMRDWRVWLYLLFVNVGTLGLGIALIATGQQIFHVFIGPVSAAGLLVLGYVTWVQPERRQRRLQEPS